MRESVRQTELSLGYFPEFENELETLSLSRENSTYARSNHHTVTPPAFVGWIFSDEMRLPWEHLPVEPGLSAEVRMR